MHVQKLADTDAQCLYISVYLYGSFVWSCNGAIELTALSLFLDANSKITTWIQYKEYLQKLLAVWHTSRECISNVQNCLKDRAFLLVSRHCPHCKIEFLAVFKFFFLNSASDFKNNHMACYLYTFNESEDHYMKAIS